MAMDGRCPFKIHQKEKLAIYEINKFVKALNTIVRKRDAFKRSQIYEVHRRSYLKLSAEVVDAYGFSGLAPRFYIQYQSV